MEQLESEEIQGEAGHSSENENQHEGLVNEIIAMFERLEPPLSSVLYIQGSVSYSQSE